jgi:hypothetical protein
MSQIKKSNDENPWIRRWNHDDSLYPDAIKYKDLIFSKRITAEHSVYVCFSPYIILDMYDAKELLTSNEAIPYDIDLTTREIDRSFDVIIYDFFNNIKGLTFDAMRESKKKLIERNNKMNKEYKVRVIKPYNQLEIDDVLTYNEVSKKWELDEVNEDVSENGFKRTHKFVAFNDYFVVEHLSDLFEDVDHYFAICD